MNRQINDVYAKEHFYLRTTLCMLIPAIISRSLALGFSAGVQSGEMRTWALKALDYGQLFVYCFFIGCALAAICSAIYTVGARRAVIVAGVFALICAVDLVWRYFTEIRGDQSGFREISGAVSLLSEFAVSLALALCVWMIGFAFRHLYLVHDGSRKYSVRAAVNASVALRFAIPFVTWCYNGAKTIIASDPIPTVQSISDLVASGVRVVVFYAIVVFIGSRFALKVCTKTKF